MFKLDTVRISQVETDCFCQNVKSFFHTLMSDLTVYKVIIYRHTVSLTSLTKTNCTIEDADSITTFNILLFIYIQTDPKRFENLLDIEQVLVS
jgi:hypothetical protein